jgi:two-component system CheB/CheR fusion protein
MAETTDRHEFTRLLEYLKATRGFDFSGYKLSTLLRRVQKRMSEVEVATYADYIDYLEVHPGEYQPLFNTVLINVTSLFRDRDAWDALAAVVLPEIIDGRHHVVRAWCAGCASGEETYTLAILLAEAMGEESFRQRVKIYGTDADEEALAEARLGSYDERRFADAPPELVERYFEPGKGKRTFRPDLRRSLIFGRHDLVQDAAISRVDLVVCRNVLMYFNMEAQAKIVARFHFALNPEGYLFLGKAETLLAHGGSFKPVDLKRRIFQRLPSSSLRERLLAFAPAPTPAGRELQGEQEEQEARLRQTSFETGTVAQLIVDAQGHLALASDQAREMFNLQASDLGRPLQDLDVSFRPVELRGPIEAAQQKREVVRIPNVAWKLRGGEVVILEIQILPLVDETQRLIGVSVSFLDLTQAKKMEAELERAHEELVGAYEDLQSTKEELETTNEELQSTVEELETTNEELQSANEELETMNEELQSTNEELRTMNDQMAMHSDEMLKVNEFLGSILGSLQAGVAVLDRALAVVVWSERAEDLWGLRSAEAVGRSFLKLDIGLPVARLKEPLRACLDGSEREVTMLESINRRGRPIVCKVTCSTLRGHGEREGDLLVLMEDAAIA